MKINENEKIKPKKMVLRDYETHVGLNNKIITIE